MKHLSVFTAPKPFVDPHIGIIQRNAIRSWLAMGDVEVFLIGDETGIENAAAELNVEQIPNVKTNIHGTPLVSSIFQLAHERAESKLLFFTNTDMIYFSETLNVARQMNERSQDFVLIGQRVDLDVDGEIDFGGQWEGDLHNELRKRGSLHPLGGSDYFIFPKRLYAEIPDFAIGRAGWDNWMIHHAMEQGWQTIDATPSIIAVHQNHDYGHLESERGHQRHPETKENLMLAGGMRKMVNLLDVKFRLVDSKVQPIPWSLARFLHQLEIRLQPDEMVGRGPRWWLLRGIRKLRRMVQRAEVN